MLFTHARNKKAQNNLAEMKQDFFAEMTYEGRPIPVWLQKPAFASQLEEDKDEDLPEWLQEPAKLS